MIPGWHIPVVTSAAHYFVADGHSLCGKFVRPRLQFGAITSHCHTCAAHLAAQTKAACRKRRYSSKVDAMLVLADVTKRDSTRRPKIEHRPYYHHACGSWHLTSQPGKD